jgi:hypothetical protein
MLGPAEAGHYVQQKPALVLGLTVQWWTTSKAAAGLVGMVVLGFVGVAVYTVRPDATDEGRNAVRILAEGEQEVQAVAQGSCAGCLDEINLAGVGILFVVKAGSGFVDMSLSDRPTLTLVNPGPGTYKLPRRFEGAMPPPPPNPQSGEPDTVPPQIDIETVTLTAAVRGTLKYRKPIGTFSFQTDSITQHVVAVLKRQFMVRLRDVTETSMPDGRTMFKFRFHVMEQ